MDTIDARRRIGRCTPRRALSPPRSSAGLAEPPGWKLTGDGADVAIEKTYTFDNYYETISFVNALAFIANAQDHHPDLSVHYNRCVVRFNTHDVKGISETDFECASQVDALLRMKANPICLSARALDPGLVVASHGRHCLVETPEGKRLICHPRGKKSQAVVGDRVLWRPSGRRHHRKDRRRAATCSTARTKCAPSPSPPTSTRC